MLFLWLIAIAAFIAVAAIVSAVSPSKQSERLDNGGPETDLNIRALIDRQGKL